MHRKDGEGTKYMMTSTADRVVKPKKPSCKKRPVCVEKKKKKQQCHGVQAIQEPETNTPCCLNFIQTSWVSLGITHHSHHLHGVQVCGADELLLHHHLHRHDDLRGDDQHVADHGAPAAAAAGAAVAAHVGLQAHDERSDEDEAHTDPVVCVLLALEEHNAEDGGEHHHRAAQLQLREGM